MIYYVEDDINIRELVLYTLEQTALPAKGFSCAEELYEALHYEKPSLILLDIMLPNEDGISILSHLRNSPGTSEIPVIMLTAKGTEYDTVFALDKGADDYITKPFGMAELVARIRAMLRRTKQKDEKSRLVYGNLVLDSKSHEVTVDGEKVLLTYKEFELLNFLMINKGEAFSRDKLLDSIWDYGYAGGTRTVDVHIQTLRAKLGPCGNMIETVRGIGYRFGGRDNDK